MKLRTFLEKRGITYSVLSVSSPHLHMGDSCLTDEMQELVYRRNLETLLRRNKEE